MNTAVAKLLLLTLPLLLQPPLQMQLLQLPPQALLLLPPLTRTLLLQPPLQMQLLQLQPQALLQLPPLTRTLLLLPTLALVLLPPLRVLANATSINAAHLHRPVEPLLLAGLRRPKYASTTWPGKGGTKDKWEDSMVKTHTTVSGIQ